MLAIKSSENCSYYFITQDFNIKHTQCLSAQKYSTLRAKIMQWMFFFLSITLIFELFVLINAALEEGAEKYFSIPCKCKFSSLYLAKDKHKCLPDFIQIGVVPHFILNTIVFTVQNKCKKIDNLEFSL